jgi:hypothetical protein
VIEPLGTGTLDLDFWNWDVMGMGVEAGVLDFCVTLLDVIFPYVPTLSASGIPYPWFLRHDTWVLQHYNNDPAYVTFLQLEPFISAAEEMLRCWLSNGYNSFIHQRLYEKGIPICLQDSVTTLAVYPSRTPMMKNKILQNADERSSALAL